MTNETSVVEKVTGAIGSQFNEGKDMAEQVTTWLTEKGLDFAMNLVFAIVILLVGWLAIKLISLAVRKALMRGKAKGRLLADFVVSVVTKACWAVLLVMVLGRLGVNVTPLIAGLGVTGFILGFAFQESLGNLASGMMIALNEPFKVGDFVDAAGHSGVILEVNMMATVMKTGDNKRIVIPNKSVWGGPIVNYNTLGLRRVDLQVGEHDPVQGLVVALEAEAGIFDDDDRSHAVGDPRGRGQIRFLVLEIDAVKIPVVCNVNKVLSVRRHRSTGNVRDFQRAAGQCAWRKKGILGGMR